MISQIIKQLAHAWQKKRYLTVFCVVLIITLGSIANEQENQPSAVTPSPKKTELAVVVPETVAVVAPVAAAPAIVAPAKTNSTKTSKNLPAPAKKQSAKPAEVVVPETPSFGITATRVDDETEYGRFVVRIEYQRLDGYTNSLPAPVVTNAPQHDSCQLLSEGTDQYLYQCDLQYSEPQFELTFSVTDSQNVTKSTTVNIAWE